jgi:hypothetical protein
MTFRRGPRVVTQQEQHLASFRKDLLAQIRLAEIEESYDTYRDTDDIEVLQEGTQD